MIANHETVLTLNQHAHESETPEVDVSNLSYTGGDRRFRLQPYRSHPRYWVLTELARTMAELVDKHARSSKSPRLFDFGCGDAPYLPLFEDFVAEYALCDLPGNKIANYFIDSEGRTNRGDGSADIVMSSQVLEHVVSPTRYLSEARRILSDQGVLILSTHGYWRYHPDPTDLWRWTSEGLRKVVTDHGFDVLDFRGVLGPGSSALQLLQDALEPRVPWRLRSTFYFVSQQLIRIFDSMTDKQYRDSDACVYILVAKKRNGNSSTSRHS